MGPLSSSLGGSVNFRVFLGTITWFSALRRRIEFNLLQSRDDLQREVAIRTRQANLLNLTHDLIFVPDIDTITTYLSSIRLICQLLESG